MSMHRIAFAAAGLLLGPAHAQSSVQIWGIVDQGLVSTNDGSSIAANPGAGGRNRRELKHAWQPRLGFRGTEDLGGGLAAYFDIEHRFGADDGAAATPFWAARSVVGLRRAGWGDIRLGREYNPAFYPAVTLDPFNWNTVGQMGLHATWARYNANDGGPRNNNQIQYRTPDLAGFTALAALALGENGPTRGNAWGANVIYAKGPLYVGAAIDRAHKTGTAAKDARLALVGASYDFGFIRPRALVARSTLFNGTEIRSWMVGAVAPIGVARIVAGYSKINPSGANNTSTKLGLGYHYSLSKKTMIYTDVGSAKTQGQTRSTSYDLGVRHDF